MPQFNIMLSDELYDEVRRVSNETGKTQREIVEEALSRWLNVEVRGYVDESIQWFIKGTSPGRYCANDLYHDYKLLCKVKCVQPVSQTKFGRELKKLGIEKHRNQKGVYYVIQ